MKRQLNDQVERILDTQPNRTAHRVILKWSNSCYRPGLT